MTRSLAGPRFVWMLLTTALAACSSSGTKPADANGVPSSTATTAATTAATATSTTTASVTATATAPATATATGATPPAGPVDAAVVRKACAAPCSNEFTSIQVYRDERGAVRRYERTSNPGSCSHAPTIYFDERGTETGAIPLVPVVPGSEQARKFDATREQQTGGLHKAESLSCSKPGGR